MTLVVTSLPPWCSSWFSTSVLVQPPKRSAIRGRSRRKVFIRSIHGDHLFRTGRMDGNGFVEVFLGRAHSQRHRESLQQLVGAHADRVQADDALLRTCADELHRALGLALQDSII